jgi:integrase
MEKSVMARRVKDKVIDSREARAKLKARGKPFYRLIEPGLHLGYRRLKGRAGTWVARHYIGEQKYEVEGIGVADDLSDPDGIAVLSYWQAQAKARERMVERAHSAAGKTGPLTVARAMDSFIEFQEAHRKSASDVRYRDQAVIRPILGDIEVAALKADQLRKWLNDMVRAAPRLRTRKGEEQNYRRVDRKDDEAQRRRKTSANRNWAVLRAALNMAWREGKVASNAEWSRVKPFQNVEAARVRYLSVAEAQRLINACDPDFRNLVRAALETGCRYGELARLEVSDFNPDAGTVAVRQSKGGKSRHVILTEEGTRSFTQICAGRSGHEIMLLNASGGAWGKAHQGRPMAEACKRAKISPPANFHALRHTWASLAVMNGVPLMVIGRNLGHADTKMVEKHYGHLAPTFIVDAIRAGAPRFGVVEPTIVTPLARR